MALRCLAIAGLAACSFKGPAIGGDAAHANDATDAALADAALDAPAVDALPAIALAQVCSNVSFGSDSGISCMLPNAQTIGNTNIVVVDWGTNAFLVDLSDSAGNIYVPTGLIGVSDITSVIYYATITHGGTNRVTATLSAPATIPKVRVLEYAGLSTTSPYLTGVAGSGANATSMTVGPVVSTVPHALIFAAARPQHTSAAVAPLVARDNSDGDLVEDEQVFTAGAYSASATQVLAGTWVMIVAAFRGL